jgi:hypothetical protein
VYRVTCISLRRSLMITALCLGLLLPGLPNAAASSFSAPLAPRAAVDIPDGTVYGTNTTWTGDQVYLVHGQIRVDGGATLTIRAGATVKFDVGGSLRVDDGALIADGAISAPITFTSQTPGVTQWAGLRFTDASAPASFDAAGEYVGGSLLRYVSIAWADAGVSMTSQAPYVADSLFTHNNLAVDTGGSPARLERNTLSWNQLGVQVSGGTQDALIHANTFTDNVRSISNSGMAVIVGNTITGGRWGNSYGAIIHNFNPAWNARIYDNRIIGNTGGLALGNIRQVDIHHNLITDNSGDWCDGTGIAVICLSLQATSGAAAAQNLSDNTIINNRAAGLRLGGAAEQLTLAGNNWFSNGQYDLFLRTPAGVTVTVSANYWGGLADNEIAARIYDCSDTANGCGPNASTGQAMRQGALPAPSETAPAFINQVQVLPGAQGLQPAAFDLTFSRPMLETASPALSLHAVHRGQVESIIGASLTQGGLIGLTRDAYGQMWFDFACSGATGPCEPLRRFDGDLWVVYNPQNAGLPNETVRGVYGQSSGDVWASFAGGWIGRYHNAAWRFMQPDVPNDSVNAAVLTALGEDAQGHLWVGASDEHDRSAVTLLRFAGSAWQAVPLPALPVPPAPRDISHIVTDGTGRTWVKFGASVFIYANGVWSAYQSPAGGPPAGHFADLWRDSRGRLWVSADSNDAAGQSLYRLDGQTWAAWGAADWGNCAPDGRALAASGFTEDDKGGIWANGVLPCGVYRYDGEGWEAHPEIPSNAAPQPLRLGFDALNNLWIDANDGTSSLYVKWGGLDYTLIEGSWLSPTRYRAPYSVGAFVPRGNYTLDVTATDSAGMAAMASGVYTFTMDYAAAGIDTTPPTTPHVVALGDGSLSHIGLSWQSQDPESGVTRYRYAVGSTPGGHDVLAWADMPGTITSANLTGLLLTAGQHYYATVAARNPQGLWSADGVSLPVIAGQVTQISTVYLPTIRR